MLDFDFGQDKVNVAGNHIGEVILLLVVLEFDIALKDEENRAEYRLELLNSQVFFFPIYGVIILF